jgi:predicted acylesterase/phospholipase RssA
MNGNNDNGQPPPKALVRYYFKAFWLYAPGVFTVLLSYFLLTNLTQGQDVVMLIGESTGAAMLALVGATLWAFLLWYSSRLIGYEKLYDDARWPKEVLSTFPRLLAYNAFVSLQAAIVALPTLHQMTFGGLLILTALHNAYYFFLFWLFKPRKQRPARGWQILAVALALAYIAFLFSAKASPHYSLCGVAALLCLLQVLTLRWFVHRRATMDEAERHKQYSDESAYLWILWIPAIRIPKWFIAHERNTFWVFNGIAALAFVLFAFIIGSLSFTQACGPLPVLLLAFALLAGGFNIITASSLRWQINLFAWLLLWAWLLGQFSDPYEIEPLPYETATPRPHLDTYFQQWVDHRGAQIDATENFPVFVVLADGGASRSGYWVASVLDAWQQMYAGPDNLNNHLLCLSGTSGGSVGNAAFYAQLQTQSAAGSASRFLQNDFLSHCLAHMLGTDPLKHVLPLPLNDRARAIAAAMEIRSGETLDSAFAQPWHQVIDQSGRLPLLFINTTAVQGGAPGVVSTVQLKGFSKRLDVLNLLGDDRSISLATAAVLGARFPYVSPAGSLAGKQWVDGGYFDNSGAGVVQEMLYHLNQLIQVEADTLRQQRYRKLRFHVVHITNSPLNGRAPRPISPLANDLAAPLLTVFNTYAMQTEVNDERLRLYLRTMPNGGRYHNINLYTHDPDGDYPMNWVISNYQLNKMDSLVIMAKANELKTLGELMPAVENQ